jgi:transcriptional regulator with XRE-family HTH domain
VSTVRRRRLAHELRRLREEAGLTIEDVAVRLECSASKISRVETGRVSASPRDVRDLAAVYGVPEAVRDSLVQLARESRRKGWWHAYGQAVQPHLATYLDIETTASEIRIYRISRLPGQLQTDDYTRALVAAGEEGDSRRAWDRHLELLQERRRLASVTPSALWVVLDEAALRREVGGPGVLRAQIEHLIAISSKPGVCLQVIPFDGGASMVFDYPFAALSFPDPDDPDVVALGYPTGVLWIEDSAEVRAYRGFFDLLQAAALPPQESVALMRLVLTEMSVADGISAVPQLAGTTQGRSYLG